MPLDLSSFTQEDFEFATAIAVLHASNIEIIQEEKIALKIEEKLKELKDKNLKESEFSPFYPLVHQGGRFSVSVVN
jgi:hypothetical protein